jgi:regulatory protein
VSAAGVPRGDNLAGAPAKPASRGGEGAFPTQERRADGRPADAYQLALRLVGVRAHSEAELRRKLLRRGCPRADAEAAVDRLREQGYLDDRAYAAALVERRAAGRGEALIAAELAAKGIGRDLAADALDELSRARQLEAARRLAGSLARTAPTLDPHRLAARLHRRGFRPEIVREALALALDEDGSG